jgi:hypothetical protein
LLLGKYFPNKAQFLRRSVGLTFKLFHFPWVEIPHPSVQLLQALPQKGRNHDHREKHGTSIEADQGNGG